MAIIVTKILHYMDPIFTACTASLLIIRAQKYMKYTYTHKEIN